jgi:hypothetical protein
MPFVRLACIARGEAANMPDLAAAVAAMPIDDAWFVLNGEDADGTEQAALEAFEAVDIPCKVFHSKLFEFDFGSARNEMLELAAESGAWLLLLDPDSPPVGALPDGWDDDPSPVRELQLRDRWGASWWMSYLVNSDAILSGARYVGRAHEFLALDGATLIRLDSPFIDRRGFGATPERNRWYVKVLREDLQADPGNARAAFYLANTLRDMGEDVEALQVYITRAAMPGSDEETFWAIHQAGCCLDRLGNHVNAMRVLLMAHTFRPSRPEPLCVLAQLANRNGEHLTALAMAQRGLELKPTTDELFIDGTVTAWGLALEQAVAWWYLGKQADAYAEFERILAMEGLPDYVIQRLRDNLTLQGITAPPQQGGDLGKMSPSISPAPPHATGEPPTTTTPRIVTEPARRTAAKSAEGLGQM